MTLQARADGAQDKHGYRGDVHKCELCGQLVVSVCDSLDMGDAVTCHYEPASEGETARRIAELEAELVALRSRLEFTSCQKADVEAQVLALEEQNAALRQDAEIGRALTVLVGSDIYSQVTLVISNHGGLYPGHKTYVALTAYKPGEPGISAKEPNVHAALVAAGLIEEEK